MVPVELATERVVGMLARLGNDAHSPFYAFLHTFPSFALGHALVARFDNAASIASGPVLSESSERLEFSSHTAETIWWTQSIQRAHIPFAFRNRQGGPAT